MKVIVRTLLVFVIVIWIGGVLCFPLIASEVRRSGADPHAIATIISKSRHDLHVQQIWAGIAFLVLLFAASKFRALPRSVTLPAFVALVMLALTVFSQYWIAPQMEQARIAAGGTISNVAPNDPNRVSFNKLYSASKGIEITLAVGGIALIALLAWNFPDEEKRA